MVLTTHPPSNTEVKERVEVYINPPPLWAFVACSRGNFVFVCVVSPSSLSLRGYTNVVNEHACGAEVTE